MVGSEECKREAWKNYTEIAVWDKRYESGSVERKEIQEMEVWKILWDFIVEY